MTDKEEKKDISLWEEGIPVCAGRAAQAGKEEGRMEGEKMPRHKD